MEVLKMSALKLLAIGCVAVSLLLSGCANVPLCDSVGSRADGRCLSPTDPFKPSGDW